MMVRKGMITIPRVGPQYIEKFASVDIQCQKSCARIRPTPTRSW